METQNVEYKESWRDECLKWICGFANAKGGKVYIGVNDNGDVCGVDEAKKLLEDIPNKISNFLGIVCDVNLLHDSGKEYIEIVVSPSNMPISYKGVYHYRSGATKQELKGVALQQFIMTKMGHSWDDMPVEYAGIDDIDRGAINYFLRCGISSGRIPEDERDSSTEEVLNNLGLITPEGKLKTAAILLFGKHIRKFFPAADFKIGRFHSSESDLVIQDLIECNLIQMAGKVIETLKSKYLLSPIRYEGLQRIEELEIPEDALRELIYNSIAHKDYSGPSIQMRVYDKSVELWNYGLLPAELTPESLMHKHSSYPRNKNIAYAFFKAGFVESWGRGYKKIQEVLARAGMPMPVIQEVDGGVRATMRRLTVEEINALRQRRTENTRYLSEGKLTARQCSIYAMIRENPYIVVQEMVDSLKVSRRTVERELSRMQRDGIIRHEGNTSAGVWVTLDPDDSEEA